MDSVFVLFVFRFDFDKQHIEYDWYFPKLVIDCIYNVTGQVLLLPIQGHGKGVFNLSEYYRNILLGFHYH